jgi:hypothetical protein
MTRSGMALLLVLVGALAVLFPFLLADAKTNEVPYYSDRFVFLGNHLDDLVAVIFNFNRGWTGEKPYGEFSGALFHQGRWSYLEGSDLYPYPKGHDGKDLAQIQPSYYAKVVGSATSGFKLRYDGGDHTLDLSSGPIHPRYFPHDSPTLKSSIGSSEALLVIRGREYWGKMIHEPLIWSGFNGLKQYRGLFKEYHRFYLLTDHGGEVYFYKNRFNRADFMRRSTLPDAFRPEGGVMISPAGIEPFDLPIQLQIIESTRSFFSFFLLPTRWKMPVESTGTFRLWSRGHAEKGWFLGGYHLMAIEGTLETDGTNARVWGMAEYVP